MIRALLVLSILWASPAVIASEVVLHCWQAEKEKTWENTVLFIGQAKRYGLEILKLNYGQDLAEDVFPGQYRLSSNCFDYAPDCTGKLQVAEKQLTVQINLQLQRETDLADILQGELKTAGMEPKLVTCERRLE